VPHRGDEVRLLGHGSMVRRSVHRPPTERATPSHAVEAMIFVQIYQV
jgi:hypothetical protein